MVIDQSEIDALLAQAENLVGPVNEPVVSAAPATPPPPPSRSLDFSRAPISVRSLLRIRVPLIVRLAHRRMPVAAARSISLGMIIEFQQSSEENLDLLVNNRVIGAGEAVKCGEHFGIRVLEIGTVGERIRAMGSPE